MSDERSVEEKLTERGAYIPYNGPDELSAITAEFAEVQAQRRAEKLTAAKREVEAALSALATDREGREAEMAADAIANLIRVIVEEKP